MKTEHAVARSPAQEMIEFLHALTLDAVPAPVIEHAKWCLLDSLGCGLFGSGQPWSKIMAEELFAEGSRGNSSVFGYRKPLAGPAAALCNGTASHGFELDDLLDEAIVHPGAIVVPAALAAAEAVEAPGARLVLGIIAGYEVMDRVGRAIGFDSAHHGFHKTSLVGPLGAVVAAGIVMGLTRAQMHAATGLACSTASGIKSFAAGTGGGMMKRMHAGRPAEAGVRMAQLAKRDFTGPPSAIDGRFGMLEVFGGPTADPAPLTAELGSHWAVEHVYVKVYPCCSWIQASVQQLAALRGPQPLDPREIAGVRIGTNSYAKRINGQPAPPDTMGAQYSIPYCAALALTGDPADPAMYGPDRIDDRARRELAARVELVVDPEMEAVYPKHYGARVELRLASGERRESFVMDPHGMPGDPCNERERLEKFSRLASSVMPPTRAAEVAAWIRTCDRAVSVRALTEWLRQ